MKGVIFVLLVIPLNVNGLTVEELAAFTPRDPDHVDVNTGTKSEVSAVDNGDGSQSIYTNGIPSHPTWTFPDSRSNNPHSVIKTETTLRIYSTPILRATPLRCIPLGPLGFATSGVAIDSWFPAEVGCPPVSEFEELDICEGHPAPTGQYHYHHYSPCVQMPICGEPSTIWGVAIDGIPIYGPYDEDGRQLTHQDLDECGGKKDKSGRYKYHMTVDPPFSLNCLRGEIRSDVGKDPDTFTCSCPHDDRMFVRPDRSDPDSQPVRPSPICEFSDNGATPATCNDTIDTSYDIGYTWKMLDREIKLAPCCPRGVDCGLSCKDESGIKAECEQETRTVKYQTRVLNGARENLGGGVILVSLVLAWVVYF